jgi:hypothetical protein
MPTAKQLRNLIASLFSRSDIAVQKAIPDAGDLTSGESCQHRNASIVGWPTLNPVVRSGHQDVGILRQIAKLVPGHAMTQKKAHYRQEQVAATTNDIFFNIHVHA